MNCRMQGSRRIDARWIAGGLLFAAGCQDVDYEPHFGRLVSVGEHVEIWASPGVEVCGGNVDYLDAFVDKLRAEVGPHPEAEDTHRYYVLNGKDWKKFDDAVDCRGEACTTAFQTVYTQGFLPSTHEMVHAELFTNGHRFLEEGLAVVYGETIPDQSPVDYDIIDGLSESWVDQYAYVRSGHFASFVIDRHGIGPFMSAKDASREGDSLAELSRIFADELGEPLEELLLDYEEYEDECEPPGYQALLVECDQTPTPWRENEWGAQQIEFNLEFGCRDGNVLGPYGGRVYLTRAFELQERTEVIVAVRGGDIEGFEVTISRCDGSCSPFDPAVRARTDTFVSVPRNHADAEYLHPGRYTMRISKALSRSPSSARVLLTQLD